jgi:FkbM family methyltransferase
MKSAIENVFRAAMSVVPRTWKRRVKVSVLHMPDVESSMLRMKSLGFLPQTVVDVGAYHGDWTRTCKEVFPQVRVLMVEPQHECQVKLQGLARRLAGLSVQPVLLGATEKDKVGFFSLETASSVFPETAKTDAPSAYLQMTTLDKLTERTAFATPDFLKLDVQGYELEVLKGAERALDYVQAILMEVNLIEVYKGAPLFHDVSSFMAARGFVLYDVCTLFHRPYDGALWQMDVVFLRSSSPLLASKQWAQRYHRLIPESH